MHDLLANVLPAGPGPKPLGPQPALNVRDDAKGRVIVDGLTEVGACTALHACLLKEATAKMSWRVRLLWDRSLIHFKQGLSGYESTNASLYIAGVRTARWHQPSKNLPMQ